MKFEVSIEAQKTCEKAVGKSFKELRLTRLSDISGHHATVVLPKNKQIHPRGSVYVQLGRISSIVMAKKIINKF